MPSQKVLLVLFTRLVSAALAQRGGALEDAGALVQEALRLHRGGLHEDNGGAALTNPGVCAEPALWNFAPDGLSLSLHQIPRWFQDAKLGIFIHWGLYSVPAFASRKYSFDQRSKSNRTDFARNNPYAEWYLHSSVVPGSVTGEVHRRRYGEEPSEQSYLNRFVPEFNNRSQQWDPSQWADAFKAAGAKYAVLTTKHHDSFCLWPSTATNPNRRPEHQHALRDIVGELSNAVRDKGLEMGLYYSGGYDWSFKLCPEDQVTKNVSCTPDADEQYQDLALAHLKELIALYRPSILWNDIGWPGKVDPLKKQERLHNVFAQYFNKDCPQGVVNARWGLLAEALYTGDFRTPEYRQMGSVTPQYHEMCRGIGKSFGYNAEEGASDYMRPATAIWLLATTTASNGNLLLDVGPTADGAIPEPQMQVLRGLGEWMSVNAEAIHGTGPYLLPGMSLSKNVVYTRKLLTVYAIVRCPDGCRDGTVTLDREELMKPEALAELLVPGGAVALQSAEGRGWLLTSSQASSTTPLVLRFSDFLRSSQLADKSSLDV